MNPILIAVAVICLCAGFWADNEIHSLLFRFWWLPLVAAYVIVCRSRELESLTGQWRNAIVIGLVAAILLGIYFFDDTLKVYISGVLLLFSYTLIRYLSPDQTDSKRLGAGLILLVALSMILLPVAINRIVVKLPNLSGGTTLTLIDSDFGKPGIDAEFFNQGDDHYELTVNLGSQIYVQQQHIAPLLEIDILRPDIVVRVLSISYQSRLGYLDIPLFELTGNALMSVSVTDTANGNLAGLSMDRERLLISQLVPDLTTRLQLPHMQGHFFSVVQQATLVAARLIIWLLICLVLFRWAPQRREGQI